MSSISVPKAIVAFGVALVICLSLFGLFATRLGIGGAREISHFQKLGFQMEMCMGLVCSTALILWSSFGDDFSLARSVAGIIFWVGGIIFAVFGYFFFAASAISH